ncbi:MAG: YbfB/YjiJ family MFS transporter [Hyphomicrobiales bacterium]|nr:MAG: YbfB/YjiJ family MFS transporter [Hyphomicrobiales bacterium]
MSGRPIEPLPLAVGGLIALAVAVGVGRFIYTPILPPMVEALGLTKSEAGLIASANFAGYLAGALCATLPWGKDNPRRALLLFLGLSGLSTAAMALGHSTLMFSILRGVGGFASAYVLVLASSLVLGRLGRAGAGNLSYVHFAGVGVGIAGSALLVWALAAVGADWRAMWLWSGLCAMISAVFVVRLVPPDDAAIATAQRTPAADVRNKRALMQLSAAYGLFGFGYVITATFIVAIVRASPSARAIEPVFWLIVGVVAIPSVWLWVQAGRRLGAPRAFAVASALLGLGVIASVVSTTVLALALSCVLLGGTFMGVTALGLIGVGELAPEARDTWIAIATSAFSVGQIAGPLAAGYGYDLTESFLLPSLMAAAALAVGAGLTFNLGPDRTEAQTTTNA